MKARKLIDNVKKELNIEHDKELAELAGIKIGTLTQAIARNSFQFEILIPFLTSRGVDLNRIFADIKEQSLENHVVGSVIPRISKSVIDTVVENEAEAFAKQLKEAYRFIAQYGNMILLRKFEEELLGLSTSYVEKCAKFRDMIEN